VGFGVEELRPKSVILPVLLHHHRAAVRFDLRTIGVDLDDVFAERLSWNTVWDLISELMRNPSSHLISAMFGDKYVPGSGERAQWAVFEMWLNTQLPKGHMRVTVKRPWAGVKPVYAGPKEVDPQSVERRAKLAAMF